MFSKINLVPTADTHEMTFPESSLARDLDQFLRVHQNSGRLLHREGKFNVGISLWIQNMTYEEFTYQIHIPHAMSTVND
jgi:hypothetical protein